MLTLKRQPIRAGGNFKPFAFAAMLVAILSGAGCTTFDPLDSRGETINRNAADYSNNAILLNVIRAKLYEPLSFVAVTGITGTSQASGSLGFGGITLGPHISTTPARDYVLGPNSIMRGNTNSYNFSVVDDPASFAALLAPINPAIIGALLNQGYPRELLMFLFIDHIRIVESKDQQITNVDDVFNNPEEVTKGDFKAFIEQLATLLRNGFTAQVDITSPPSGRLFPASKFCIDPGLPLPDFARGSRERRIRFPARKSLCDDAPWISSQGSVAGSASPSSPVEQSLVPATDGAVWRFDAASGTATRIAASGGVTTVKLSNQPTVTHPKLEYKPAAYYTVLDEVGTKYLVYTRSTYGVYDYIGALLREGTDIDLFPADQSGYKGFVNVRGGDLGSDCFAEVTYRRQNYCAPASSSRTKRLFTLLHQLQQLNTAPSNAASAVTVIPIQ